MCIRKGAGEYRLPITIARAHFDQCVNSAAYCYIQMVLVGEQNVPLAIGSLSRQSRPAWAQTDTASHQISVCQIYGNGLQQLSRRWH